MLRIKIQGNQPSGSGVEDSLRFVTYMGMAAILVMRPCPNILTFSTFCLDDTFEI